MDLSFLGQFDRVYTYARVSSQTQYERQTIEVQENRLKAITPPPAIAFRDIQGGDEGDRPGYQKLIETCTSEAVKGLKILVVVTEQSRLSREGADTVTNLLELFDALGITAYALDGGLLTVKDAGQWLAIGNKALFDAYFLRQHRQRLRKGREQRRKEGKPVQPNAPMGYRWTRDKYELNEDSAIARQLFEHYLPPPIGSGWSLRKCAKWLEEKGKSYTAHGVRQLLINPMYRGILSYSEDGLSREEQKRGISKKPKIFLYDQHEAIITEDEWRLIEQQLEDNRQHARRGTQAVRYPLSGLVWCARCSDRKMVVHTTTEKKTGRRYSSYECPNCGQGCSYRILEGKVIQSLCDRATELASMAAEPEEDSPSVEEMEIRRQISELEAMYRKTQLSGIKDAIAEMRGRLNQIEFGVKKVEAVDLTELVEALSDPEEYGRLPDANKRLLYHDLIERVDCDRRNIKVTLKF